MSSDPWQEDALLGLAPWNLPSRRRVRFAAHDQRGCLASFTPADQELLREVYRLLLELKNKMKPVYHDREASLQVLRSLQGQNAEMVETARHFGHETLAIARNVRLAQEIHDLRAGAFQALALRLELIAVNPARVESVQNVFFLARDHLKIIRNCVEDLDPEATQADALQRSHDAALLVEKWTEAQFHGNAHLVKVEVDCRYQGTLCESCLEFSSLDRIIYNLMNNAARHSADGLVHFDIWAKPDEQAENIRFIVANAVSSDHEQILRKAFPDLSDIFRGGFTTGGNGMGMRICADFCLNAYGLNQFDEGRTGGYFGACWIDHHFVAWFHWPVSDNRH